MSDSLLAVERLTITLPGPTGPVPITRGVDLRVDAGEIVGLAGESGSGKSMTAAALMGLLPHGAEVGGSAHLGDVDLLGLQGAAWNAVRGRQLAMVFQDAATALHPMLTVGRQLTEHVQFHLGLRRRAADRRAVELLERVHLPQPAKLLKTYPHQLSGGMRQRVAIAAALACEPRLVIADEPTTALDVTVQAGILQLLDELRRSMGLAVLFITHDLAVLSALTARSYVLYAGTMMESADTTDLLVRPRHPYTAALLAARPQADDQWEHATGGRTATLTTIPGVPATAASAATGCAFAPRCRFAQDRCGHSPPAMEAIATGHAVACHVRPELHELTS